MCDVLLSCSIAHVHVHVHACFQALEIDANNVKGLARRGNGYLIAGTHIMMCHARWTM